MRARCHVSSLALFTGAAAVAWGVGAGVPHFSLTSLGSLGGSASSIFINDSGLIAGYGYLAGNQNSRGFVYTNGSYTLLPSLGNSTYTVVNGMNNVGQVVGGSNGHAFVYAAADGSMIDLGTFGRSSATANAINDHGDLVASSWNGGTDVQAHLYSNGSFITLPTFAGGTGVANDINNAGMVAGSSTISTSTQNQASHGYTYLNGVVTEILPLASGGSSAGAINDWGEVAGSSHAADGDLRAYHYADGIMTELGSFGFFSTISHDINNASQVVGQSQVWESGFGELYSRIDHAFLSQDGAFLDLNDLVDLSSTNFSYLWSATSINESGQIVGIGETLSGTREFYLLTPISLTAVPEPAHAALTFGGAVLGFLAWRRRARGRPSTTEPPR